MGPRNDPNIIAVRKFFSAAPWLIFDSDGTGKIDGVKISVYLEGAQEPKGVFGNGTLVVEMYRLDLDPTGRENATLVYKWEMSSDEAYPWRRKKETGMGWGYGLCLQWPKKLDVGGRQVAFLVKYVRDDGRVVSASRQVLKVPIPGA